MSDRYCAWIRIGGSVTRARARTLVRAIRESGVRSEWGEPYFEPETAADLIHPRKNGWLWLCDEEARNGEFPDLEKTCRRLGLGYTRHSEAYSSYDAELVEWRPGMRRPLVRTGSNEHCDAVLVPLQVVERVLAHFEAGRLAEGMEGLRRLCPEIPVLPPFAIE
jgi:hypothetical protein